MAHDFTLVYALNTEVSQDEVLRRLACSDCADATVGWGRPGHVALAFSREARNCDAAVTLATAQMAQAPPVAVLVRVDVGVVPGRLLALSSNRAMPAQPHVRSAGRVGLR